MTRRMGIIGCGTIGSEIALAIDRNLLEIELTSIYDINRTRADNLKRRLGNISPMVFDDIAEAIRDADLVFESARIDAVKPIAEKCIPLRKELFIMSAGSLIIYPEILDMAREFGCKIHIPSGAISGLDGISAAKLSGIKSVLLKSTKPLNSLLDSPGLNTYLKSKNKSIGDIGEAETIFQGNVKEAVASFPQNVNVSAALALCGLGPEKTLVRVIADPFGHKNIHEIECVSEAGNIYTRTENVPHPENPRTSYLAILSAMAKLKQM